MQNSIIQGTQGNFSDTPHGTMQNLNPTRILARRGRDIMLIGALVLLAGLVVGAFSLLVVVLSNSTLIDVIFLLITLVLIVAGIGLLVRGLTYRKDNEIARVVGDTLAKELDDQYVYIRNLSRRRLGYIDALLIGPAGALVFRVTDVGGIFLNEGSDWLERKGGQNFALSRYNFTRECVTDIYALRDYLARLGMAHVPVYGVVVFTNGQAQISTRQPVVPVAELRTLMVVLRRDFFAQARMPADQVKKAVDLVYN